MDIAEFTLRTKKTAQQLNLSLETEQIDTLMVYLKQLQRWNKTYNLTALREPEQMLVQHIFDSLAVVPALHNYFESNEESNDHTSKVIADIGSGGGLPGLVLAVACSTWNIHCVDAVEKKMAFVRQMAAVLKLNNLTAHHLRVEQAESFNADVVISRAFASLSDFVKLSEKHVNSAGQIIAMKARRPEDEVAQLESETDWRVEEIQELIVPELNAERCLVYMKRKEA